MKKKLIGLILSVCILFSGCGGVVNAVSSNNTSSNKESEQEEHSQSESKDSEDIEDSEEPDSSEVESSEDSEDSSSENEHSAEEDEDIEVCVHVDDNNDEICDECYQSVIVTLDIFSVNDLHGKFTDSDSQPGVDELTTYLKNAKAGNENTLFLSTGDMWQGGPESNLTKGKIVTDWLGGVGFSAMTLGNHEYDWGEAIIEENAEIAEFPLLAINVYDRATNTRVAYCQPSVMVEQQGLKIGVIGAIGDCYSSISSDKVEDVYFKTGDQLTALVKAEANRLRNEGADVIVYSLHDGYGSSKNGNISNADLDAYYDIELSQGYVDIVFEGHSHQKYVLVDSEGVYHLQGGGDNDGITHAEMTVNVVKNSVTFVDAEYIASSRYASLSDDPLVAELLAKYEDEIAKADEVLGMNARYRSSNELCQTVAQLYYQKGVETWGDEYNIVLGGGFISARSPYSLYIGQVKYADLQSIFTFDNPIVLCRISGKNLRDKFFETDNSRYYISYGAYGESVKENINLATAYYIVTDTYTSQYSWNGLTEVARLDETTFARDLLAEYIKKGGFA